MSGNPYSIIHAGSPAGFQVARLYCKKNYMLEFIIRSSHNAKEIDRTALLL
jgi:hypothetical protein